MRIGIDFDNTIAGYDQAFVGLAVEWGLIPDGAAKTKTEVRDTLRAQDGGEHDWQRLQGRIYGAELARADLIDGVGDFLTQARQRGDEVFIVSHKTEFGHFDPDRVNLRDAARQWMTDQGFFSSEGYAIDPAQVYFLPTREEKVAKIADLGLDWFIDDLPEVLNADGFPKTVERVLFANAAAVQDGPYKVKAHWSDIQALILS